MVEVTLAQYTAEDTQKPKACWYPFKEKRDAKLLLCSSHAAKNVDRKERLKAKKKSGSISTATATDESFLSEGTPTIGKAGNSYHPNYRINNNKDVYDDNNSLAGYSYENQTNSIADSPSRYNQSPLRLNKGRIRPQNQSKYRSPNSIIGDYSVDFIEAEQLAEVETNCMTKDFWKDEAYACTEARNKRNLEPQRNSSSRESANNTLTKLSPKGVGNASIQKGQNSGQQANPKNAHSLVNLVRFVAQDPEAFNDGAPLRRILCSTAPMICRAPNAGQQQRRMAKDSDIFQVLHRQNTKEMPDYDLEQEEPNFYVEVEAMREQLNKVKDLDDFENPRGDTERQRQAPVTRNHVISNHDRVDSAIEARARAHRELEKQNHRQDNTYVPTSEPSRPPASRPQVPIKTKQQFRDRLREKIGRQNQVLSEIVPDRVISMRREEEIGLNPRDSESDMGVRQSTLKTSNRGHGRNVEFVHHNRHVTKSHSPPRYSTPPKAARSYNPNNVSEFTEASEDLFATEYKPKNVPANCKKEVNNEERKGNWRESEIGYYRKPNSPSHPGAKGGSSHQRDRVVQEKFDDNFFEEDSSDINTEAFEKFGSEADSVFDDLKSQSDFEPKSPKNETEPLQNSFQGTFGCDPSKGQSKIVGKPNQRYVLQGDALRSKGKRTTYLQ